MNQTTNERTLAQGTRRTGLDINWQCTVLMSGEGQPERMRSALQLLRMMADAAKGPAKAE